MNKIPFQINSSGKELVQYNIQSSYEGYVSKGRLSNRPDFVFPSHWHEDLEFSVVLDGQMDYNIDGRIETVHAGEGIFINSQHVHSNFSPEKTDCEYICVLANPVLLCVSPDLEARYLTPLLKNEKIPYILFSPETDWQAGILRELKAIYDERDDPASPLLFQSHLCRIWANLFGRTKHTEQTVQENGDLVCIKKMILFIQKNYQNRITLQEIASSGAVGQSKCCKVFKRYLKQTPNDYLTMYRLDKSRELLLEGKDTVAEIAWAVGYSGASYFTESFRKRFGMTPSEYKLRNVPDAEDLYHVQ